MTYDELKAMITDWLQRPDLSDKVANFITLAEAEFNRSLRTVEMEARSQATVSDEYIAVPDDFLALREIHIEGTPDKIIKYVSPQELNDKIAEGHTNAYPLWYTLVDNQYKVFPVPSEAITVEIIYIQQIPALSASNTTNWLLTAHPDLYLYCALGNAEAFIHNDKRIGIWQSNCGRILDRININANKRRIGSAPLVPRVKGVI